MEWIEKRNFVPTCNALLFVQTEGKQANGLEGNVNRPEMNRDHSSAGDDRCQPARTLNLPADPRQPHHTTIGAYHPNRFNGSHSLFNALSLSTLHPSYPYSASKPSSPNA